MSTPLSNSAVLPRAHAGSDEFATQPVREGEHLDLAMERYVDGDLAAFDELYAGLSSRIYAYLLQLVRDHSRAEDLMQVTFMRLHAARGAWARGARVLPWVVTIARNAAFDELRSRSKARVRLTASGEVPDLPQPTADEGPDADVVEALERAVARLPETYREALTLTKRLDMTVREAAAVVGTTETAMKLRVHRAYKKLRRELGAPGAIRVAPHDRRSHE